MSINCQKKFKPIALLIFELLQNADRGCHFFTIVSLLIFFR